MCPRRRREVEVLDVAQRHASYGSASAVRRCRVLVRLPSLVHASATDSYLSCSPHISLVYGDLSEQQREGCVGDLQSSGRVQKQSSTAVVAGVDHYEPVETLLVETKGPSSQWKVLGKVSLQDGHISQ